MRTVAQYAFETAAEDAFALCERVEGCVESWLDSKGDRDRASSAIALTDGRHAVIAADRKEIERKHVMSWRLQEPTEGGQFRTNLEVATDGSTVACACCLSAGYTESIIAPFNFDARCPSVLRDILALPATWRVAGTAISTVAAPVADAEGAGCLVDFLRSSDRTIPVVVVSRFEGFLLHPDIVRQLTRDLAGLALVFDVSDLAAWEITKSLGKEFSCFMGAIRVYWPRFGSTRSPFDHPLWTSQRLLTGVVGTEAAARRIRNTIRRRIFAVSTFTVSPSALFTTIPRHHVEAVTRQRIAQATAASDFKALAEEYAKQSDDLRQRLADEQRVNQQLREDLYRIQASQAWADVPDTVDPVQETPPSSVEEAVTRSRRLHAQYLTFGDDVQDGVRTLAEDAGPPEKILEYLDALAELVTALRSGPLGTSQVQWLRDVGVIVSDESDTIRNSKAEMRKRTWHDGRSRRGFEMHCKPSEATSPDRCARIYYAWDEASRKMAIGWVGRHP